MLARRTAGGAVVAALLLAGCSTSGRTSGTPAPTVTRTVVHTVDPHPSPVGVGPTTSATGTCRLLPKHTVHLDVGMRLGRVTVQRAGGKQVGCTFYALQNSPLATSEHLPGPHQPAVQIVLSRYASATAAYNAMVRTAEAGRASQQVRIGGRTGLAYQIDFYPRDHGRDWACAFHAGSMLAVIKTVTTGGSYDVTAVARHLATALD